jgi:hypothetical protein
MPLLLNPNAVGTPWGINQNVPAPDPNAYLQNQAINGDFNPMAFNPIASNANSENLFWASFDLPTFGSTANNGFNNPNTAANESNLNTGALDSNDIFVPILDDETNPAPVLPRTLSFDGL